MQPKQNPTPSEALLLIRMKRARAKAAMDHIVQRFGVVSNEPEPGSETLLDYLANMVYALELLLKVMADDWRTPGRSRFNHHVGEMYQEIFNRPTEYPELMAVLERAIINQKFIYEPADRLMDHIPELEALWDELTTAFYHRRWMEDMSVQCEVVAPPGFIQYLRETLHRFYRAKTDRRNPRMSREHQVQMLQHHIQALQSELKKVEASEELLEETSKQFPERPHLEHAENLARAASCFDINLLC